jgi:hypothetical protein
MLYGAVPRSIARSLMTGSRVELNHAPDGLTEQVIDDLLDELGCRVAVAEVPGRPGRRPVGGSIGSRPEQVTSAVLRLAASDDAQEVA